MTVVKTNWMCLVYIYSAAWSVYRYVKNVLLHCDPEMLIHTPMHTHAHTHEHVCTHCYMYVHTLTCAYTCTQPTTLDHPHCTALSCTFSTGERRTITMRSPICWHRSTPVKVFHAQNKAQVCQQSSKQLLSLAPALTVSFFFTLPFWDTSVLHDMSHNLRLHMHSFVLKWTIWFDSFNL